MARVQHVNRRVEPPIGLRILARPASKATGDSGTGLLGLLPAVTERETARKRAGACRRREVRYFGDSLAGCWPKTAS